MVSVGLVSQLRAQLGTRTERLLSAARLAALVGLLLATAHQVPPKGVSADHPAKWVLMVSAGIGWIGWMASRRFRAPDRTTWCFLALLAVSGGALAAFAPIAITFLAVAGLGAGIAFDGSIRRRVWERSVSAHWWAPPRQWVLRLSLLPRGQSPWSSD